MFFWNSLAFLMIQRILPIWAQLLEVHLCFIISCHNFKWFYTGWWTFQRITAILVRSLLCQYMCVCLVVSDSETLMDYSPPGFSFHGIFQTRTLKWVAMPSSRGSSRPKDQTHVSCTSCIGRQNLYHWAPWKALTLPNPLSNLFSRYWFSHAWPILTSCFCYCFLLVDIACYSAAGGNEIGLAHFSLHRAKFSGRQCPFLSRHKSTIW